MTSSASTYTSYASRAFSAFSSASPSAIATPVRFRSQSSPKTELGSVFVVSQALYAGVYVTVARWFKKEEEESGAPSEVPLGEREVPALLRS